ncbi:MAG: 4Fe-4S binding protein [Candidatus Moranbacteria bacterium]|nr:4Fe-4S binding protein [Candidatus Moranbacteria bacterium]
MKIKINNVEYSAKIGETILDVCKRERIRIPTLCAYKNLNREAVCRMCLVEVNKSDSLVTSCSFKVCGGLEVTTESERIQKARKVSLELLFADHAGKCVKCRKNRRCELQNLAEENKIDNFHFVPKKDEIGSADELDLLKDNRSRLVFEDNNRVITRTTEYCISCRRCVNVCPTQEFGLSRRAADTVVGTPYGKELDCIFCGACVRACPTGALTDHGDIVKAQDELDNLNKLAVAIVDETVLRNIADEIGGLPAGDVSGEVIGYLHELGFEKVFSLSFGLGKWIESAKEKMENRKRPIISDYCPSVAIYVKKYFPSLADNLLGVPTPDDIMARYIKNEYADKEKIDADNIVVISISGCLAKRKTKGRYLDHVMSPSQIGRMVRVKKIGKVEKGKFDHLAKEDMHPDAYSMNRKGGVANALSSGISDARAASGIKDIKRILEDMDRGNAEYDFADLMVCDGGCENK